MVSPAFLQYFLESFHISAFSILNCLHSTFAVEQLPIHGDTQCIMEKCNVKRSSISVAVSDVFC